MKKIRRIHVILALYPVLTALGLIVLVFMTNMGNSTWDIDSINTWMLDIPIPPDATAIEYDGHQGRGGWLDLHFESSNETMDEFVKQFCGGKLYQGYDPFNAVDTVEQIEDSHFIDMVSITYFSHSINTLPTIYGMRCLSPQGRQHQLIVNKAGEAFSSFRLEVLFACPKCNFPLNGDAATG